MSNMKVYEKIQKKIRTEMKFQGVFGVYSWRILGDLSLKLLLKV